jgi:hypothetical protein
MLMNRYGLLFLGLILFGILITVGIYFWMNPQEIPSGFTFFTHPENAG